MTGEQRQAIVRRYYDEIWSQGRLDLVDDLFAEDYVNIDPATPGGAVHGRAGMKALVAGYRAAFPDLRFTIEAQFGDADRVVSRWTARGTHRGPLLDIPPSGRAAAVEGITVSRFAGDLIAEDYVIWDALGLLRQLGVVPAAA
jgi:steroid delta-isomerase-like uncharacterized protein